MEPTAIVRIRQHEPYPQNPNQVRDREAVAHLVNEIIHALVTRDYEGLRPYFELQNYEELASATSLPAPAGVPVTTLVLGNIPTSIRGGRIIIKPSLMGPVMKRLDVPFYALKEDCRRSRCTRALFRMKVLETDADAIIRTLSNQVLFCPDFLLVLHPNGSRDQLSAAVEYLRQNGFIKHGLMTIERERH
jgi:hypothetical protein